MSDVEKEVERMARMLFNASEKYKVNTYGIPPTTWPSWHQELHDKYRAMARAIIRDQKRQAKLKRRVKK